MLHACVQKIDITEILKKWKLNKAIYPLRPKKSDVFYFETSRLTVRLIQKFYVNYKIN